MQVEIYKYDSALEIPKIMLHGEKRTTITFEELKSGGKVTFEINRLIHKEEFLKSSFDADDKRTELYNNGFLLVKESLGWEYWEKKRYYCIADKKINNIQTESISMMGRREEFKNKLKSFNLFQRVFQWKKCVSKAAMV